MNDLYLLGINKVNIKYAVVLLFLVPLLTRGYLGSTFLNSLFTIRLKGSSYSFLFMLSIRVISISILFYALYYMESDLYGTRFISIVFLFIASMLLLIGSGSLFTMFIGWDGLGITSYLLVAYYLNYKSINSGMVTILSNRVGDAMFVLLIAVVIYSMRFYLSLLLVMVAITKSAQYPYSAWLPLAISAPTPVRALVHSSTLVTAGVYLLITYSDRYNT